MAKKDDTKRYTAEALAEMRRRGEDRSDWAKVAVTTEAELQVSIAADPDDAQEADWTRTVVEERPDSDLDMMMRLAEDASQDGFAYFGRIEALTHRLQDIVGRPVDVVIEPVRKDRLRRVIEKEGALAF